jgi:hypothetical protein
MKPYIATYPDGTTMYLTKDEAVTVVSNARSATEPKGMQRSHAEARGLLTLFDEGLDGLYFENVTIIPTRRAAIRDAVLLIAYLTGLTALAFESPKAAAALLAFSCFLLLLNAGPASRE